MSILKKIEIAAAVALTIFIAGTAIGLMVLCTVAKLSQVSVATSKILAWLLAVLDSCEQRFAATS